MAGRDDSGVTENEGLAVHLHGGVGGGAEDAEEEGLVLRCKAREDRGSLLFVTLDAAVERLDETGEQRGCPAVLEDASDVGDGGMWSRDAERR